MVTLSKSSWYVKLLNLMWGQNWEDYKNFCPLFWAVIGSLMLFPVWGIFKILGVGKLWKIIRNYLKDIGFILATVAFIYSALVVIMYIVNCTIISFIQGIVDSYSILFMVIVVIFTLVVFGILLILTLIGNVSSKIIKKTGKGEKIARTLIYPFASVFWLINFIGQGIYNIYKKRCPLITWED